MTVELIRELDGNTFFAARSLLKQIRCACVMRRNYDQKLILLFVVSFFQHHKTIKVAEIGLILNQPVLLKFCLGLKFRQFC